MDSSGFENHLRKVSARIFFDCMATTARLRSKLTMGTAVLLLGAMFSSSLLQAENPSSSSKLGSPESSPRSAVVEMNGASHRLSMIDQRLCLLISALQDVGNPNKSIQPTPARVLQIPNLRGQIKQVVLSKWRGSSLCAMTKARSADGYVYSYVLFSQIVIGARKGEFSVNVHEIYETKVDYRILALNGDCDGDKITALIGNLDSGDPKLVESDKPKITHGVTFYSACPIPGALGVSATEF